MLPSVVDLVHPDEHDSVPSPPATVHTRSASRLAPVMAEMGLTVPSQIQDTGAKVPSIWIGPMLHLESSRWLREKSMESADRTVRDHARRLAVWISFLHRGLHKTVHDVRHDDWLAFLARYWRRASVSDLDPHALPDDGVDRNAMSDDEFIKVRSTVNLFHGWLERSAYRSAYPFEYTTVTTRGGSTARRIGGGPKPKTNNGNPLPVHPIFLQSFLDNAADPDSIVAPRDLAFVRFVVGSGHRRSAATHLTHYELPDRPQSKGQRFVPVPSPREVSKTRGYEAHAFTGLMDLVWVYADGMRNEFAVLGRDGGHHRPATPIRIIEADDAKVTYVNASNRTVTRSWNDVDAEVRRNLVDVDGTSPALWLTRDGTPMSYSNVQHIMARARKRTIEVEPDFPAKFRLHDLRHTHACLLSLYWFFTLADHEKLLGGQVRFRIETALGMAQRNLGHASERTTEHYLSAIMHWVTDDTDPITLKMLEALS